MLQPTVDLAPKVIGAMILWPFPGWDGPNSRDGTVQIIGLATDLPETAVAISTNRREPRYAKAECAE